ncbi:toxin glutamine deamidase domain-containing protein [Micromonosporaceae bacterium Da 78-11]
MTVPPSPVPHPLEEFPFDVPRWAYRALEWVVGPDWPQGDESATWDVADGWYALAGGLTGPHDAAFAAAGRIVEGYGGAGITADGFLDAWHRLSGEENAPLNALLQIAHELGAVVEECARDIEAAKLEAWIELGTFLIELRGIALVTAVTVGATAPAAGGLIAATRIAVQQIFDGLVEQLDAKAVDQPARHDSPAARGSQPARRSQPVQGPRTAQAPRRAQEFEPAKGPRPMQEAEPPRDAPGERGLETVATSLGAAAASDVSDVWGSRFDEAGTARIEPGGETQRLFPPVTTPSGPVPYAAPPFSPTPAPLPGPASGATGGSAAGSAGTPAAESDGGSRGGSTAGPGGGSAAGPGGGSAAGPGGGPVGGSAGGSETRVVSARSAHERNRREDYLRYLATVAEDDRAKMLVLQQGSDQAFRADSERALRRQMSDLDLLIDEIETRMERIKSAGSASSSSPADSPAVSSTTTRFPDSAGQPAPEYDRNVVADETTPWPDAAEHRTAGRQVGDLPAWARVNADAPGLVPGRGELAPGGIAAKPASDHLAGPGLLAPHHLTGAAQIAPDGGTGAGQLVPNHLAGAGQLALDHLPGTGQFAPDQLTGAGRLAHGGVVAGLTARASDGVRSDGRSALTGRGGHQPIDKTRRYNTFGGLRPPLAVHQRALDEAMPRDGDGRVSRLADPRLGRWFGLLSGGGPEADPTRGLNCVDAVLALFDTYLHGRPRVSAPRTFDSYAHGDPDRPSGGEWEAVKRIRLATGATFQNLCPFVGGADPALAKPVVDAALSNLTNHLHNSGHGAYAFILTDLESGGCHCWAAVNQGGTVLFLDPQLGRVSADAPLYTHQGRAAHANVVSMDALVVKGDGTSAPLPFHGPGQWAESTGSASPAS